jgi:hypothetical protein
MIVKDMNNLTISAKYTHIVVRLCTGGLIYACLSLTSLSALAFRRAFNTQINKLIGTMIVKDMNNLTISAKYTHIVVRLCTDG